MVVQTPALCEPEPSPKLISIWQLKGGGTAIGGGIANETWTWKVTLWPGWDGLGEPVTVTAQADERIPSIKAMNVKSVYM